MLKGLKSFTLVAIGLMPLTGNATSFQVYNTTNGYSGDGSELAEALLAAESGITIVSDSVQFMGSMDGSSTLPPPEGEGSDSSWGDGGGLGSAAFYYDLDFGTIDGVVDFVLPNGILLTSGNADLPLENTSSSFTGMASGAGDAGLDALLSSAGYPDLTFDATVLSFDFTVPEGANAVSLQMIFGSEEYPEFVDAYPEIAAVFVDGVNYAGFADGGLLTVTSANVGAGNFFDNNIWGEGDCYEEGCGDPMEGGGYELPPGTYGTDADATFEGTNGGSGPDPSTAPLAIEYDGVSRPLTLIGLLDPDTDHHTIKIAISDTNDQVVDSGIFVADLKAITIEDTGWTPDDPLLPEDGDDGSFDFVIEVGDTGVGVDPTFPIFIDPEVAVGYVYEVTGGGAFASVVIPNVYGDGLYNLWVWDGTALDFVFEAAFGTNETYNFLTNHPDGVTKFKIDGIEVSANIDPTDPMGFVTGITFTSGGTFNVTQTPITTTVPEPSSLWLLGAGVIGFGGWRMRRKNR